MVNRQQQQIKNSFTYFLPLIVSSTLPILTLPIYTRIFSKEDFGAFALAQAYAVFASGLANFGLLIGYERNFFQYRASAKSGELLYSVFFFVGTSLSCVAVLTFVFRNHLANFIIGSREWGALMFWVYCSYACESISQYFYMHFRNSENAQLFSRYRILQVFFSTLFSLVMVVLLGLGIIGLPSGQMLGCLVILFLFLRRFMAEYTIRFDKVILLECLKISYPLTPRIFFKVISTQFDKYMIGLLGTLGGVGIYNIGQKLSYTVFGYMTALENVFTPQVYKFMFDEGESGRKKVGQYLTPFLYISVAVALAVSLFCEEVIIILTPETYHGAIEIVMILSMYFGLMFFGKQPQLIYAKKTAISSILSVLGLVLTVLLNIPFVMKWGAVGAAWATLLTGLIMLSILFPIGQHYYRIEWEYKKICLILALFLGGTLLAIIVKYYSMIYAYRLSIKAILIMLYGLLGVKLHILTISNFILVKKAIFPQSKTQPINNEK